MKIFYRIVIILLIAAGCFWLVKYPPAPKAAEMMTEFPNPVREAVAERGIGNARDHLNEGQQLLYDAIYAAAEETQPQLVLPITNYTGYDIERALFSILNDCPELFWLDFSDCSYILDNSDTTINLNYLYSGETLESMRNQLSSAVDDIVDATNAQNLSNEYEKAVYVHDFITAICEYDRSQQAGDIHNAYGALGARLAVCDGYAHAYQLVLQQLGIECHYVPGRAEGPDGTEGHAWNIAKLDGVYTHVDLTWDDLDSNLFEGMDAGSDVASHTFFGLSDEEIFKTHTVDENFQYALPAGADASWFAHYGLVGASAEEIAAAAADVLIKNMEKTTPYVEIQLTDKAAFYAFGGDYEGGIDRIIEAVNTKLEESGSETRFEKRMGYFVTNAERGCILIIGMTDSLSDAETE